MTAVDWPALGSPSPKDALAAALQGRERSEAERIIGSSADFRDAAQCLLPVLRLARDDRAMIDAAARQALALFLGGWLQNRQLPSLLFCLRVAGQHEWMPRFCRRAVERARQTGDWTDLEKVVEWFATSAPAEEDAREFGFSRESLAPVWGRLSEAARARLGSDADRPEEPAQEVHAEFERGGISASSISEALAVATGEFAAVGSAVTTRSGLRARPAPPESTSAMDTVKTPTDQLRALAARPLQEMRARVAGRLPSLPAGSQERAEAERELARIDRALRALP